jgi:hypothetical protein
MNKNGITVREERRNIGRACTSIKGRRNLSKVVVMMMWVVLDEDCDWLQRT